MILDDIQGAKKIRDFIDNSVTKETKQGTYQEPFGIDFRYRNLVEDHNNQRHVKISLDMKWAARLWPDCNLA